MRKAMLLLIIVAIIAIIMYANMRPTETPSTAAIPVEAPPVIAEIPIITLSFAGDIMFEKMIADDVKRNGAEAVFTEVAPLLQNDDLTYANLESAASTRGKAYDKKYTFRMDPTILPAMRSAGIEAVSLANNHALDFGQQALRDTLDNLAAADITAVGAGKNFTEASAAQYFTIKGIRIALIAASRVLPTAAWIADEQRPGMLGAYHMPAITKAVKAARKEADLLIIYFHWGIERQTLPADSQRQLAKSAIDAGADLVIGSHPHVLQGFGSYQGKLIAYSLGNFIFYNVRKESLILQTDFQGGKLLAARAIPCEIRNGRPYIVQDSNAKAKRFQSLQQISEQVTVADDGTIDWQKE